MTSYTARALSTDKLQHVVHQVAHGFVVGDILRFNGAIYVKGQSNNAANAEIVGMVSFVVGADDFVITQMGYVINIPTSITNPPAALTPGSLYYLDPANAGKLTLVKPASAGEVVVPCFIADTATSGYFFASVGDPVSTGGVITWNVVTVNTPMVVNNGYFTNSGGNVNLLLPPIAAVGDLFKAANYGAGNFTITQNAGDSQVLIGGVPSTVGIGGSVACINQYSAISGVCVISGAGNVWFLMDVVGNYNVV